MYADENTSETILHELAVESKAKVIKFLLEKDEMKNLIVGNLLMQDNLGYNPLMSATKSNKNGKAIIEMFLNFLLDYMTNPNQLESLLMASTMCNETLFTLLVRNVGEEDFSHTRSLLFSLLKKHFDERKLVDWFLELTKQVRESKTNNLSNIAMKELIRLGDEVKVDFKSVLTKQSKFGNTLLMKLAMKVKDEALREILTNTRTSKYVSLPFKTMLTL